MYFRMMLVVLCSILVFVIEDATDMSQPSVEIHYSVSTDTCANILNSLPLYQLIAEKESYLYGFTLKFAVEMLMAECHERFMQLIAQFRKVQSIASFSCLDKFTDFLAIRSNSKNSTYHNSRNRTLLVWDLDLTSVNLGNCYTADDNMNGELILRTLNKYINNANNLKIGVSDKSGLFCLSVFRPNIMQNIWLAMKSKMNNSNTNELDIMMYSKESAIVTFFNVILIEMYFNHVFAVFYAQRKVLFSESTEMLIYPRFQFKHVICGRQFEGKHLSVMLHSMGASLLENYHSILIVDDSFEIEWNEEHSIWDTLIQVQMRNTLFIIGLKPQVFALSEKLPKGDEKKRKYFESFQTAQMLEEFDIIGEWLVNTTANYKLINYINSFIEHKLWNTSVWNSYLSTISSFASKYCLYEEHANGSWVHKTY